MVKDDSERTHALPLLVMHVVCLGLALTIPAVVGWRARWQQLGFFATVYVVPVAVSLWLQRRRAPGGASRAWTANDKRALLLGVVLALVILVWTIRGR